jgi:hypothetical protein
MMAAPACLLIESSPRYDNAVRKSITSIGRPNSNKQRTASRSLLYVACQFTFLLTRHACCTDFNPTLIVVKVTPKQSDDGQLNYSKIQSTVAIRARRVVIAAAPNVTAKLNFSPELPEVHRKMGERIQVDLTRASAHSPRSLIANLLALALW